MSLSDLTFQQALVDHLGAVGIALESLGRNIGAEWRLWSQIGGALSIWDHLFGTYAPAGDAPIRWGLVGERVPESFVGQIFVPVVGLWGLIRRRFASRPKAQEPRI